MKNTTASTMKIAFAITHKPAKDMIHYAPGFVEGPLKIYIGDKIFFNQENILLLELAIAMNKWLQKITLDPTHNFIYETMEHEEPIFTFIYQHEDEYLIDSIWKEDTFTDKTFLKREEIVAAFRNYIEHFRDELYLRTYLKLDPILRQYSI